MDTPLICSRPPLPSESSLQLDLFTTNQSPAPPHVLLNRPPDGRSLRCPIPSNRWGCHSMPVPQSLIQRTKDQGGSDRGGICHSPQLAKKVLVPIPPDGMRDPSPLPLRMDLLSQCLPPHRLEDPWVDGVEDEQHTLQDISEMLPLKKQLEQCIKVDGKTFVSWCDENGQKPIRTSLKLILGYLQFQSETGCEYHQGLCDSMHWSKATLAWTLCLRYGSKILNTSGLHLMFTPA